jgi:hypothetical protein
MKDELDGQQQTWGLFEEWKKQLDEYGKEEWLTFRKREYFKFQDFFMQKQEAIKAMEKNVVTKFLNTQIE